MQRYLQNKTDFLTSLISDVICIFSHLRTSKVFEDG